MSTKSLVVYLSGPMTGKPDKNRGWFRVAKHFLHICVGFLNKNIINPHELPEFLHMTWADYLERDLGVVCECDLMYMLPGWSKSRGAGIEVAVAKFYGIPICGAKQ